MNADFSFAWPRECRAAISLTFDDGLRSQLAVAIPTLEERGLCGTFYLNPRGEDWQERLAAWQPAHEAGHEMGNHTMAHPCSMNTGPILQGWTLAQIEEDVVEAQRRLGTLFPGERSFAYPCYESDVGRGPTRTSYVPVIARHFAAARARGEAPWGNDPLYADLHYLSSWEAERKPAWEMIGLVEECVLRGWWGVFTFHGVNEGHLPVAEHDLCGLIDYLVRHQERVWTAPVIRVAMYVEEHR
jgi:peptidoglycan/xylan/chitin deacetylase (PgdA/CDA1 family)